jgi:signal-induced proliferation-associated 1 like protein 3
VRREDQVALVVVALVPVALVPVALVPVVLVPVVLVPVVLVPVVASRVGQVDRVEAAAAPQSPPKNVRAVPKEWQGTLFPSLG